MKSHLSKIIAILISFLLLFIYQNCAKNPAEPTDITKLSESSTLGNFDEGPITNGNGYNPAKIIISEQAGGSALYSVIKEDYYVAKVTGLGSSGMQFCIKIVTSGACENDTEYQDVDSNWVYNSSDKSWNFSPNFNSLSFSGNSSKVMIVVEDTEQGGYAALEINVQKTRIELSKTNGGANATSFRKDEMMYARAYGFAKDYTYGCTAPPATPSACNTYPNNYTKLPNDDWTFFSGDKTWRLARTWVGDDIPVGTYKVFFYDSSKSKSTSYSVSLTAAQ